MARRRNENPETEVAVEVTNRIKIDGAWRSRGDRLLMTTRAAEDLVATHFGCYVRSDMNATNEPGSAAGGDTYRRRDMKAG